MRAAIVLDDRCGLNTLDFGSPCVQEIVKNAKFTVGGISRFDVVQGELGDCWCVRDYLLIFCVQAQVHTFVCPRERRLLAAIACLSMYEELFNHVIPKDEQEYDAKYCGM